MIAACWAFALAAYFAYAALLGFASSAAHSTGTAYAVLAVLTWAVLAAHHNRRHR